MTGSDITVESLEALREDLAYHQARVLMLIVAVSTSDGHNKKLDGLTKLAKLDFLTRYPALGPVILDNLEKTDTRLHLDSDIEGEVTTDVESPMVRYKYGPWDDRYYPVIGALVGRGLIKYAKGKRGSIAFSPTPAGKKLAEEISQTNEWNDTYDRCIAIAQASAGFTGSALKNLIYERLSHLLDRPYRELIK